MESVEGDKSARVSATAKQIGTRWCCHVDTMIPGQVIRNFGDQLKLQFTTWAAFGHDVLSQSIWLTLPRATCGQGFDRRRHLELSAACSQEAMLKTCPRTTTCYKSLWMKG